MIEVVVPCSCPARHEQDSVYLAPELDVRIGVAATVVLRQMPDRIEDQQAALAGVYLHHAIRDWTFTDEKGDPLPITMETIDERLTFDQGGFEIADKAAELYHERLFAPLVRRRSRASSGGPTDASTSPTPEPGSDTDSSDKPSLHAVTGGKRSAAKAS